MKKCLIVLFLIISFNGCGQDNYSNDNNSNDNNSSNHARPNLVLKSMYELPYKFGQINQNVLLDGDSIILVGGEKADPRGAQFDGHPAFSNKAIKIDLVTGAKQTLDMNATTGHIYGNGTVANGRGNSAKVYKLEENKYIVYGGFQYVKNMEILDFNDEKVRNIETNFQIIDSENGGLNTTTYFADKQASAMSENKDIYFFGFNNGLYGMKIIIKFDYDDENLTIVDANLTMARSSATAYKLADGRIIIIGGWDGSGDVTADSATRRVEIFNPSDNSIVRVSDFPVPIGGQRTEQAPTENDSICVNNYQYTVSQDKWESGCNIITNLDEFDTSKYTFSGGYPPYANYFRTLSNGDIVFIDYGTYSLKFADDLQGYPVDKPTKFYVYSVSN